MLAHQTDDFFDEVWVVPCGTREDKDLSPGHHWVKMIETAIQEHGINEHSSKVKINQVEIENGAQIPTYYLMQAFEKENPDQEHYFVGGTDLF